MHDHTLQRTGEAPIKFRGEVIAEAGGKHHAGREQNRWHTLTLYRSAGGKYVLHIDYSTQWQGESDISTVEVLGSPESVVDALHEYRATIATRVVGYPPGEHYAERQARLIESLETSFDAAITELLRDEEFADTID